MRILTRAFRSLPFIFDAATTAAGAAATAAADMHMYMHMHCGGGGGGGGRGGRGGGGGDDAGDGAPCKSFSALYINIHPLLWINV